MVFANNTKNNETLESRIKFINKLKKERLI